MAGRAHQRGGLGGLWRLVVGVGLLAFIAFVALPAITSWTHGSIRPVIDERDIEADALFWTESREAAEAYRYLRDVRGRALP